MIDRFLPSLKNNECRLTMLLRLKIELKRIVFRNKKIKKKRRQKVLLRLGR